MSTWRKPRRILVAVSATVGPDDRLVVPAAGHNAAMQAAAIAQASGAHLRVIHVIDFVDRGLADEAMTVEQRVIQELGPELEKLAGPRGTHGFLYGLPWEEIAAEAARFDADLLVITPRRPMSLGDRLLFGRTAGRLIRHARCPVLVVHPASTPSEDGGGIKKVLGCVDRKPVSDVVIAATDGVATLTGAERHLLTCLDYPRDIALHRLPYAKRALDAYHEAERQQATDYMSEAAGDGWTQHLGEDWVVREAPKVVDREKIDVVVIAAVSKPRLAGLLLGTTAEKLLGELQVSCLIVRPPDEEE